MAGAADECTTSSASALGPFNLGLACLTDPIDDLDGVFLEARDELAWHPGMLLDDATLQVPFLADLVTMADPTSRWSFLNYLKETGDLYPFYIRESLLPAPQASTTTTAAGRPSGWAAVRFGQPVVGVEHDGASYVVTHRHRRGAPRPAAGARRRHVAERAVCSEDLLPVPGSRRRPRLAPRPARPPERPSTRRTTCAHKERLQGLDSITIVGSGQSAAEIYYDLLAESPDHGYHLTWLTRSPRFFPMEYTKLTLEMTSPEYTAYFQALPELTRRRLLREQRSLYKGISGDLVDAIFDLHYRLRVTGDGPRTTLVTNTARHRCDPGRRAATTSTCTTSETDERFGLRTEGLVLATGYSATVPTFLDGVRDRIAFDEHGRYVVSPTYAIDHAGEEIFVQNAEEHTHGFVAPDLGMGAYRNSVLIAAMCGREVYPVEKRIAVQSFGVPDHLRRAPMTLEPLQLPRDLGRLHAWVTHPQGRLLGDAGCERAGRRHRVRPDRRRPAPRRVAGPLGRRAGVPGGDLRPVPLRAGGTCPSSGTGDLGMHVLVAPTDAPRRGFTRQVFRVVMEHCFADPAVRRVVVEPDVRNDRIAALNKAAGFEVVRRVRLRTKEAALSVCSRDAWEGCDL